MRLFRRLGGGDDTARDAIARRFLPLARQLAMRYRHTGEPLDDLVQVASLGLLKAIERFDPDRGIAFTSYAVPTMLGELKRHLRETGWSVRVPRSLQERSMAVEASVGDLRMRLGRSPSTAEVAEETGLSVDEVVEARMAPLSSRTLSLDAPSARGDDDSFTFGDSLGVEDRRLLAVEEGAGVAAALRVLQPREREVLRLRFAEDLTQSEIGERIGISQMHVSRLLRQALGAVRQELEPAA